MIDAAIKGSTMYILHTYGQNHRAARKKSLIADDGYLFLPEQDEAGLMSIGKYEIRDPGAARH
jgi:hypothetical protein